MKEYYYNSLKKDNMNSEQSIKVSIPILKAGSPKIREDGLFNLGVNPYFKDAIPIPEMKIIWDYD
jgi:hypothetical protein